MPYKTLIIIVPCKIEMKFTFLKFLLVFLVLGFSEESFIPRTFLKPIFKNAIDNVRSIPLKRSPSQCNKLISHTESSSKTEIIGTIAGFGLSAMIVSQLTGSDGYERSRYVKGIKDHRGFALRTLRTSLKLLPQDYNKILISAIKRNDELVIHIIRKYQWDQINFTDSQWKDQLLLSACYRNGYTDIADFLKNIHDFESKDTIPSFISDTFRANNMTIKSIDLFETEKQNTNAKLIERKERYELLSKIEDYQFRLHHPMFYVTLYWTYKLLLLHAYNNKDVELVYLMKKYLKPGTLEFLPLGEMDEDFVDGNNLTESDII